MIAEAFASLLRPRSAARPDPPDPLSDFWYGPVGSPSSAGVTVHVDNAMRVAAVFACIRVLAETFASLPCRIYERIGEDRKRLATDHELWPVLHDRPNAWQTSFEWREMGMAHLCLRGDFVNRIWRNAIDGHTEFIPLNPDRVTIRQIEGGRLVYTHRPQNGPIEWLTQDEVFHVRGFSLDGITGVSVIEYARNAVGLSIAEETHGAAGFKNGMLPAFWVKRPKEAGKWTPDARTNFRAGWRAIHAGAENAGNPPILEDGMSLEQLGMKNDDSQWLQSRGFQVVEICRFFRVPPHLIAELTRATFSNIEQQSMEFVIYTMAPWCVRFEQAAARDVIVDPDRYFVKLALEGLLRGDIASRYAAYNVGLQAGFLTRNEVRALEDLDPIDGGDEPLRPLNMTLAKEDAAKQDTGKEDAETRRRGDAGNEDAQNGDAPKEDEADAGEARAGFEFLLQDATARIAAAEIRGLEARVEKAADDPPRWAAWVSEFYRRHREYVGKTLAAIALASYAQGGPPVNVDALAGEIADEGAMKMIRGNARLVLAAWRQRRAADLAILLEGRFFDASLPKNPQ